jgi:hypothetical protein
MRSNSCSHFYCLKLGDCENISISSVGIKEFDSSYSLSGHIIRTLEYFKKSEYFVLLRSNNKVFLISWFYFFL